MQSREFSLADHTTGAVNATRSTAQITPFIGPTFIPGRNKTIHEVVGIPTDRPISLYSLPDPRPGEKPDYTYATLVKIAIWDSPARKLTLQEIYDAIGTRFPWYKNCKNPNSWKTSIRHSLSLLSAFQKVPRETSEPGKGVFWTVDFTKGEGNKRPRKRNKIMRSDGGVSPSASSQGTDADVYLSSSIDGHAYGEGGSSDSDHYGDTSLKELDFASRHIRFSVPQTSRASRSCPYLNPTNISESHLDNSSFMQTPLTSRSHSIGDISELGSMSSSTSAMSLFDAEADLNLQLSASTMQTHLNESEIDIFVGDPVDFTPHADPGYALS